VFCRGCADTELQQVPSWVLDGRVRVLLRPLQHGCGDELCKIRVGKPSNPVMMICSVLAVAVCHFKRKGEETISQ
jgi:hypothetical protein